MFGGEYNAIKGQIARIGESKEAIYTLSGHWNQTIELTDVRTKESSAFWSVGPAVLERRLKRLMVAPDEQGDFESPRCARATAAIVRRRRNAPRRAAPSAYAPAQAVGECDGGHSTRRPDHGGAGQSLAGGESAAAASRDESARDDMARRLLCARFVQRRPGLALQVCQVRCRAERIGGCGRDRHARSDTAPSSRSPRRWNDELEAQEYEFGGRIMSRSRSAVSHPPRPLSGSDDSCDRAAAAAATAAPNPVPIGAPPRADDGAGKRPGEQPAKPSTVRERGGQEAPTAALEQQPPSLMQLHIADRLALLAGRVQRLEERRDRAIPALLLALLGALIANALVHLAALYLQHGRA